ncbi:MAG: hypothetical protein WBY53_02030 [Acidobacteriaceae bacterium]
MVDQFLNRLYELRTVTGFLAGIGFLIAMFVLPHKGTSGIILGSVCALIVILQIVARVHASHARNSQNG